MPPKIVCISPPTCLYLGTNNNHAKLELCPKIKLNKSLSFSLSPFARCRYHHQTCLFLFRRASRRKIFSRFSTSMVFCLYRRQRPKRKNQKKKFLIEFCCEPKRKPGLRGLEEKVHKLSDNSFRNKTKGRLQRKQKRRKISG